MPKFSQSSLNQLSTCHPDLQVLFNEVIKLIDCQVLEGHRGQAAQEAAYAKGNTQLHYPNGKHNSSPSLAVDVAPYPVDWNNAKRFYWFAGIVLGIAHGLYAAGKITHLIRYGGDWNKDYDITDNNFNDLVHFELIM
jgi:peptidoglycan L-alanyl-D-glutamate endopeptidase CwlK